MQYEVEQKHRFVGDGLEFAVLLAGYGAKLGEPVAQVDQYFSHPSRDFATSDEALRIRTAGEQSFVTYKGPKLDKKTKTRREIDLQLGPALGPAQFTELLEALGFSKVATVSKLRRQFWIEYDGQKVEGAYDIVDRLGVFVELELIADEAGLENAKRVVKELANKLDLGPSITRSYLEMLLDPKYPRRKN